MLKVLKYQLNLSRSYAKNPKTPSAMKYLNVAEKHDAAKTIAGLLSKGTARRREGYSVYNKVFDFDAIVKGKQSKMVMTSVSGHLLQLEFLISYRNWRNVDPQSLFDAPLQKSCNKDFEPIKRTLEREIRSCQGLIIWTDCDREGENIGYEIIDVCRNIKSNIPIYRAIFSEITTNSVNRALQNLTAPDKRQSDAVDVRTELDLRTGAAITRYQTMRLQRLFPEKIADKLISYGSCQIPTLGFVAERYKEVEAFVSEPFWKIKVTHTIDDLTVDFNWARNRLFNKEECEDYLMICLADPKAKVEKVTVKPKHKWRPTPLDTVEMEKLGSRKLKLSAKETMTIAEKLYTKGIISYPRTETNMFSKEIDLRSLVEQQCSHTIWGAFAQRVMEWGPNPRNGNKSDQAHPPIHPTKLVSNLNGNEARVYELICRHFLACVSKDGVGSETVVHINIAGEKFTATGLCIYERNYLDVYIYDKWNAKQIHRYEEGQIFDPTEISMQEGATTAPPLLTEADLIALMEKHGIGTDATHAEHINTIKERGYIGVVDNGFLVPGVIGMGLFEGYDAMELVLAKPILRAQFEADLKKICLGEKDPKLVLREQIVQYKEAYTKIMEKITAMDEKISIRLNETPIVSANSNNSSGNNVENNTNRLQELFKCPKCSVAPLALKQKKDKTGHFIGCLNFPDCKNVIWLPDECKEPSVLDTTCSNCGNEAKLLKFKLTTLYHKSIFNAPFGWYKTCLRCDSKFRNEFNINIENVKRVGAIVSDISPATHPGSNNSTSSSLTALQSTISHNQTESSTTRRTKKLNSTSNTKTAQTASNIRNFFTSVSTAPPTRQIESSTQSNEIVADTFFDSNDGFDDLILAAEQQVLTNSNSCVRNSTARLNVEFNDDVAAAFADGNDDFADFNWGTSGASETAADNRNSSNHLYNSPTTSTNTRTSTDFNWGTGENRTQRNSNNDSFSNFFEGDDNFEDYTWGTAARNSQNASTTSPAQKRARIATTEFHDIQNLNATFNPPKCTGCHNLAKELNVKKDGPNKGRVFYVCPKPNPCKFFQWADDVMSSSQSTNQSQRHSTVVQSTSSVSNNIAMDNNVKCACGKQTKSLIVRKDGPNIGRPFFVCANGEKTCQFFKWGDEDDNQASTSTGIRNNNTNSTWSSNGENKSNRQLNNKTENKKKKCGLCRQEGHTKVKCPRKALYEI